MLDAQPLRLTDHLDLRLTKPEFVARQQEEHAGAREHRLKHALVFEIRLQPGDVRKRLDTRELPPDGTNRQARLREQAYELRPDRAGAACYGDHYVDTSLVGDDACVRAELLKVSLRQHRPPGGAFREDLRVEGIFGMVHPRRVSVTEDAVGTLLLLLHKGELLLAKKSWTRIPHL